MLNLGIWQEAGIFILLFLTSAFIITKNMSNKDMDEKAFSVAAICFLFSLAIVLII